MIRTLLWGISDDEILKIFPKAIFEDKCININHHIVLRNFPGDCGALIIDGANYMDSGILRKILLYASLSGFNKIFATVVGYPQWVTKAKLAFTSAKFKCVYKGYSNRSPVREDYVFVKRINNCKHKGY